MMMMVRLQDVIFYVDFCKSVEYDEEKHVEVCSWSADYPYKSHSQMLGKFEYTLPAKF